MGNLEHLMHGELVELRRLERDDLPARVSWINDPSIQETLNFDWPTSLARTEQWFESVVMDGSRVDFSVFTSSDHQYVGFCGLLDINWRARKAEAYVTIGRPDLHGLGLGTDVYRLLARYGFVYLGLERLYQTQLASNSRAERATAAAGWRKEGVLRRNRLHHGLLEDEVLLSLLREDWLSSHEW